MLDAIAEFYRMHSIQIWLIGLIVLVGGLIFWSLIVSNERGGPRGPHSYR